MDYAAWGVSWLGSWGQSWGPLHEVAETWDTSQGMARSNIKFAPIREVAVRVSPTKAVIVSTTGCRAWGSANVKANPTGLTCGICQPKTGAKANAFVRTKSHGAFTTMRGASASADASVPASSYSLRMACRSVGVRGDAAVVAASVFAACASREEMVALGVRNPGDEEIAALAFMLVTKRTTKRVELQRHL